MLVKFCETPKSRSEMQKHIDILNRSFFSEYYLKPLLDSGKLFMIKPDTPSSKYQKYVNSVNYIDD